MYVCICTYSCIYMCGGYVCVYARVACVYRYTCECIMCVYVLISLPSVCLVACYSISDSFVRSKLGNWRFRFAFAVDPIH